MFPIRLMVGAIALLIAIALTPLLWKPFDTRQVQTVALNPALTAPAYPGPPPVTKAGGNNAPQQAVSVETSSSEPQFGNDQAVQDVTGSLPAATAALDPSLAIEFPTSALANSSGAKVKHAKGRPAFRKVASQQQQNPSQYAFSQQQTKAANTEYKPVPLPSPNFTNSGY